MRKLTRSEVRFMPLLNASGPACAFGWRDLEVIKNFRGTCFAPWFAGGPGSAQGGPY
jgi:hypothetical protein